MTQADFPTEGVELTHLLVVSDLARSRQLYRVRLSDVEHPRRECEDHPCTVYLGYPFQKEG
jgi:hypothetical protein